MRSLKPVLFMTLALAACTPSPAAKPVAGASPTASPTAGPSPAPGPTNTPVPAQASPGPSPTSSPPAAVSFRTDVVPILRAHCIACHLPGGIAPREYQYFDAAQNPQHAVVKRKIGEMVTAIKAGRMPLNASGSLSASEIATLEAYRDAGAPDN